LVEALPKAEVWFYSRTAKLLWQASPTRNDFNGDGKTDVGARNRATGETALAIMDDTVVTQFVFSSLLLDPNWIIDGARDFDKDGQADVVLRKKATGDNAIELMSTHPGCLSSSPAWPQLGHW
jgi:hypothetical protein